MKRSRYKKFQIVGIMKDAESGVQVGEICRKYSITKNTLYNWRSKYGGMDVSDVKRLKALEEENAFDESFNGKFRDECLNENWFRDIEDARYII